MPKFNVRVKEECETEKPIRKEVSTKQCPVAAEIQINGREVICFYDSGRVLIHKDRLEDAGFDVEIKD